MDAEHSTSPRHLLGRVAATLLALLLLYPLSQGPAFYLQVKLKRDIKVLNRCYKPLDWVIEGTPLEKPYGEYVFWWWSAAMPDSRH